MTSIRRLCLRTLSIALFLAAWSLATAANGGVILAMEDSGPYQIAVFAESSPLRAGMDNAISILVVRRGAGDVVLNAKVAVTVDAIADENDAPRTYAATHENATNKLYYDALVNFPTEGRWQIVTLVNGEEGEGTVTVQVQVEAPRPANRVGMAALLGLPLLLMVAIVLVLTRKSNGREARKG